MQTSIRPPRPPRPIIENIPEELKFVNRWLVWKYSATPNRQGRHGKVPYNIVDRKANYTDYSEWLPFGTALRQYEHGSYDGIGLVLGDGLVGLDEDHCCTPDGFSEAARTHIQRIDSYTERSVSGDGCHVLALGTLPEGRRKQGDHEMYSVARYFCVTGQHIYGTPKSVCYRDRQLREVYAMIFSGGAEQATIEEPQCVEKSGVTQFSLLHGEEGERGDITEPPLQKCIYDPTLHHGIRISDDQAIAMVMGDKVAARYWMGCPSGTNPSRADWALAAKLAFYTGANVEQMDRLFRRSRLCCRDKDVSARGNTDYVRYTMERAAQAQKAFWRPAVRMPGSS